MRGWRQRERQQMRDGQAGGREGGGQEGREEEKLREPKLQEPSALLQMGWGQKHPPQEFIQTPPFFPCCNLHVIVYTFTSSLAPLGALIAIPAKY